MTSKCKILRLKWEQLHEIVKATGHTFRKQLCFLNGPQGPDGQVKKVAAAAAKAISILAIKVQTADLGKDFLLLLKLHL